MKNIYQFLIIFSSLIFIFSCDKTRIDENQEWQFVDESKANVKFFNYYTAVTPLPPTGIAAQRFLIYQNSSKLNGTGIAASGIWPSSSNYASLEPGQSNVRMMNDRLVLGVLGAVAAGDTVLNINPTFNAGKFYSVFLVGDSITKEAVIKEDIFAKSDTGKYLIRLANMTYRPARPVRVFSRRLQKDVITGVDFKQVSDFITVPLQYNGVDTLDLFAVGSTTRIASINSFSPIGGYTYTLATQGRTGLRAETLNLITTR
jgi:hypothetical protein